MKHALLAVLLLCCATSAARADDRVAEGRAHLESADFDRAIASFDAAEAGTSLDRGELIALLEGRATARWALGDSVASRRDLVALATIDPQHAFPPEAPPELGEAFASARASAGRLAVDAAWSEGPDGATLTVRVTGDAAGLVRSIRSQLRTEGGAWATRTGASVVVASTPSDTVEAYVELVGPGGAVLATSGSASAPIVRRGVVVAAARVEEAPVSPAPAGDDSGLSIGLGVGAGVLVLAGIVVGVVVATSGSSDQTQLEAPTLLPLLSF